MPQFLKSKGAAKAPLNYCIIDIETEMHYKKQRLTYVNTWVKLFYVS